MGNEGVCGTRLVSAPDGTQIPVPMGGLGLADGAAEIREDAKVQVHPRSQNGYYVVVNNADPANDEAEHVFTELTVEGAITTVEHLASQAFRGVPPLLFKGAGLIAGVLVSLFTSTQLTREVFIRVQLEGDGTPVTYCLLI
jgi:hypothetical protein